MSVIIRGSVPLRPSHTERLSLPLLIFSSVCVYLRTCAYTWKLWNFNDSRLCLHISVVFPVCFVCVCWFASRCVASFSGATAHAVRPTAASPILATARWLTRATTRSPCAWTSSRAAARVRSASTSTLRRTSRPRSKQPSIRPTRPPSQRRPPLQPWWANRTHNWFRNDMHTILRLKSHVVQNINVC